MPCLGNRLDVNNNCVHNSTITFCGESRARKALLDFDLSGLGTGLASTNANNTFTGNNIFSGNVTMNGNVVVGNAPTDTLAFFGGTAVVRQALTTYTTDTESVAYTGIDNTAVGTVFAQLTDLQALRIAYENLRISNDDMRAKLVATGLIA